MAEAVARRPGSSALVRWGWPALLALMVTAPVLLARGFALVGDMVFVPEQPWKNAWLGLDGDVPRAVPGDTLTWAATQVLPGDLVQKVTLLGLLFAAGLGAARLVGTKRPLAMAAATSLYVWNPFVYERLAIGHWALLCGYAALPWVVLGARDLRDGAGQIPAHRRAAALAAPVAVAAFTSPSGGLLAAGTALAVVATGRRWRPVLVCGAIASVANLPWLLPGVLSAADQLAADLLGVAAFAARADTPFGVLGSLLSFGGMWKDSVDPPTRDDPLLSALALAVTLTGLVGLARTGHDRRTALALLAVAGTGLLLAWLPSIEAGQTVVEWLVTEAPGAGILRDSQKWVAPLALAAAVGFGEVAEAMLRRRDDGHGKVRTAGLVLLPLALLPGLAWGLDGTLKPERYPSEWEELRTVMEEADVGSDQVLVLPFQVYRRFDWNADRAVLDPAPRFFPGRMVTDDALAVDEGTVEGESRTAARFRTLLAGVRDTDDLADALADEGIRWVLLERGTPGSADQPIPAGRVVHEGNELILVELSGGVGEPSAALPGADVVAVLSVAALALGGASVVVLVVRPRRAYTSLREHSRVA